MTQISHSKSTGQHLTAGRLVLIACTITFCTACSDGYPGNFEPVLMPAEMTQTQRLQQMNQIGQQSSLDTRWRYKLTESCKLKVTTGSLFSRKSTLVSLKQGQVVKSIDRVDKNHDIHLKQLDVMVPLLEAANWVDSVSFYTLVSFVQRDCTSGESA